MWVDVIKAAKRADALRAALADWLSWLCGHECGAEEEQVAGRDVIDGKEVLLGPSYAAFSPAHALSSAEHRGICFGYVIAFIVLVRRHALGPLPNWWEVQILLSSLLNRHTCT